MRRMIVFCTALLLLCSCGTSEPPYTDVNLEYVRASVGAYTQAGICRVSCSGQENDCQFQEQTLTDAADVMTIGTQIAARLGGMIPSPLAEDPASPMLSVRQLPAILTGNPDAVCYYLCFTTVADTADDRFYTPNAICFVLAGNDTPQAAYLRTGANCVWYAFDDPQGFVEEYLADAFLPE